MAPLPDDWQRDLKPLPTLNDGREDHFGRPEVVFDAISGKPIEMEVATVAATGKRVYRSQSTPEELSKRRKERQILERKHGRGVNQGRRRFSDVKQTKLPNLFGYHGINGGGFDDKGSRLNEFGSRRRGGLVGDEIQVPLSDDIMDVEGGTDGGTIGMVFIN